jgi:hydrogenase maturation protease
MRTLVLGLGNSILGDDGVGIQVAARAREALVGSGVEVDEEHRGGLRLMERLVGYDRAVIVDAIVTGRNPPGTVVRLTTDDMPTLHSSSAHDASLATALRLGEAMGLALPREVRIVAVEAERVLDFSESLTPAVAASVPAAVEAVMDAACAATTIEEAL